MHSPIIFIDLDDTVFQTKRKIPKDTPSEQLRLGAKGKISDKNSYLTQTQQQLFDWLSQSSLVIPVTGRTQSSMERTLLPFESYKVIHHGAIILSPSGEPVPEWQQYVSQQHTSHEKVMRNLVEICHTACDEQRNSNIQSRAMINEINGSISEIVIKLNNAVSLKKAEITAQLKVIKHAIELKFDLGQVAVHQNENNITLSVPGVSKKEAVHWLVNGPMKALAAEDRLKIGIGDSLSDLPFMRYCDFFMLPVASQIDQAWQDGTEKGGD